MELKYSNLDKPTNKKLKLIADYLLYIAGPALIVFFVALQPVNPTFSLWAVAGTTLAISLFKGLTKFTSEPEIVEPVKEGEQDETINK